MATVHCEATDCMHLAGNKTCTLSVVSLDDSGTCEDFEEKEED